MVEWSGIQDGVTSLSNDLERKNLQLQIMPAEVTEAARLRQDLADARKEVETLGAKLVLLQKVEDEIAVAKKMGRHQ